MEVAETASGLYPPSGSEAAMMAKSLQAWRALVSWVAVLFGLLLQILRRTPSWAQILSFVGLRAGAGGHPFISTSPADSSVAYKPLELEPLAPTTTKVFDTELIDKLTIVLDMDETLICAYETSGLPSTVRTQAIEAGVTCFDLDCLSSEKDAEGRQKINHVTVFERPGLREFLKESSEFADLVLFTAGLEDYARPVVDKIDVHKKLTRRLYRPSTVSTEYREHVKDISRLSKDLKRIVIVDNNPFSFLLQPLNGIPCVPFSAGQPCDEQLVKVILPLLKDLSLQKDVRPVLYEKFHMPEWFKHHGIPTDPTLFCT